MKRLVLRFVLQFALIYAALVWLASAIPVYVWIERALVGFVDLTLQMRSAADVSRELALDLQQAPPVYRLSIDFGQEARVLGGPMRLHGFLPVLFVALVIATPRLALKRRLISLVVGSALCLLLASGMLMNYVQTLERRSFPTSPGPYPAWIGLVNGLQRTAAGGLIPVILWGFLVSGPLRAGLSSSPPTP